MLLTFTIQEVLLEINAEATQAVATSGTFWH
jgi:hypothetical protein